MTKRAVLLTIKFSKSIGPVLGPLVMAGICVKEEDIPRLKEIGVKDSKLLSKEKRKELFEKVKEIAVDYKIEIVDPEVIDQALTDQSLNLNWLEANTSAAIVNKLCPDKIIMDCPSTNPPAYQDYFVKRLNSNLRDKEIICEHKADLNYVVVGAASILAKVTRDAEMEKLKEKFDLDIGSGYMSDPKTKNFLTENFKEERYSQIIRKTWQPYLELVRKKNQSNLFDF